MAAAHLINLINFIEERVYLFEILQQFIITPPSMKFKINFIKSRLSGSNLLFLLLTIHLFRLSLSERLRPSIVKTNIYHSTIIKAAQY